MKFIRFNDYILPVSTIEWMHLEIDVDEYCYFEILIRTCTGEEFFERFAHDKVDVMKARLAANKRFNEILGIVNDKGN